MLIAYGTVIWDMISASSFLHNYLFYAYGSSQAFQRLDSYVIIVY